MPVFHREGAVYYDVSSTRQTAAGYPPRWGVSGGKVRNLQYPQTLDTHLCKSTCQNMMRSEFTSKNFFPLGIALCV